MSRIIRTSSFSVRAITPILVSAIVGLLSVAMDKVDQQLPQPGRDSPSQGPTEPYQDIGVVDGSAGPWLPFSRDGSAFFTETGDAVRVWDSTTLKPLTRPLQHKGVKYYRLATDRKTVFTAGGQEFRLWDTATSTVKFETKATAAKLTFADSSPDGRCFVTVDSEDGLQVKMWRAGDALPAAVLRHALPVSSAVFDPTGTRIVTHGWRAPCRIWGADRGEELFPPIPSNDSSFSNVRIHFDIAGRRVVVPQQQGFTVVDLETGRPLANVQFDDWVDANEVRLSGDGSEVVVTTREFGRNGAVHLFDAVTGKQGAKFGTGIVSCEMFAGRRWALCNPLEGVPPDAAHVWDLREGRIAQTFMPRGFGYMSPDGSVILISDDDNATRVWKRGAPYARGQVFGKDEGADVR